jgi:hypothetical protein
VSAAEAVSFSRPTFSGCSGSRRPLYTPFNGFNSGLKLHLDPDIQTVQYSSLHSSGLKVNSRSTVTTVIIESAGLGAQSLGLSRLGIDL